MNDIATRLKAVLSEVTPDRGRFTLLKDLSGLAGENWKSYWYGKQRPSQEMIQVVAREWPQYAFWIVTGLTDSSKGHISPITDCEPEASRKPRKAAAEYFKVAVTLLKKWEAGAPLSDGDRYELASAFQVRQREEETLLDLERRLEADLIATISQDGEVAVIKGTLGGKLIQAFKNSSDFGDSDVAEFLGVSETELESMKRGEAENVGWHYANIADRLGYLALRDAVLMALPRSARERVRNFDNQRLRRRLLDNDKSQDK